MTLRPCSRGGKLPAMPPHHDVIVAGLGAMGSQALAACARRGLRAAGFDRFDPPHDLGSSHGRSRIIREAYFEDPIYVPLVQRAYELWERIERESGETLYHRTGGLCYGPPDGALVAGARRSARLHGLPYEELDARELRRRHPAFVVEDAWTGITEPRAGWLAPERAIAAALAEARRGRAAIHPHEPVLGWEQSGDHVVVRTGRGTYEAGQLIISAGMWAKDLLASLRLPLVVQRNVLYWFAAARDADAFSPARFPVFLGDVGPGTMLYGFPDAGEGVKVALHHHGPLVEPATVDRDVHANEIEHFRGLLAHWIPAANGPLRATAVCTYTNAPDEHFILDRHPEADRVLVASPCSGHGFKFSPAIGELLAELVAGVPTRFDLSPFSVTRAALRR